MAEFLEQSLVSFRKCFTRGASFRWFAIIVTALILRLDTLGVTSVIRALSLNHGCYDTMLHFFRSEAYSTQGIRLAWYELVRERAPFFREGNRVILVGDGVKQCKEGLYMPGVKKLHQESEDSSKAEYIFGHLFGATGVLIGNPDYFLCLPLHMSIQDGISAAASWKDSTISAENHVLQMIGNGYEAAMYLGRSIMLLDRYFLTSTALKKLKELNTSESGQLLDIVTMAKRNCRAYEKPVPRSPGQRGRPRKKGAPVILNDLFKSRANDFTEKTMKLYDGNRVVRYLSIDLLWGQGIYQQMRFVLVVYEDGRQSILASTDTDLSPETIIRLYSYRFKIERSFREFKQQFGGFGYHFWTRASGKLNHFKRKEEPDRMELIHDPKDQKKVLKTIDAIERFVQLSCFAMGLTQMMIFLVTDTKKIRSCRYLRTCRSDRISEATLLVYLRQTLLLSLLSKPESMLARFIRQLRQGKIDLDDAA